MASFLSFPMSPFFSEPVPITRSMIMKAVIGGPISVSVMSNGSRYIICNFLILPHYWSYWSFVALASSTLIKFASAFELRVAEWSS